jgi:D-alanyl-D-alanine carboxypeptidase
MDAMSDNQIISDLHKELCIPFDYEVTTHLSRYYEVPLTALIVAQLDDAGRPIVLTAPATKAWLTMRDAATKDGIALLPFSSFRSYLYQKGLIVAKLKKGEPIETILKTLAAPGYSEHHTGEALDITTTGCPQAQEIFETTTAYKWLAANGQKFGFTESFPRNNPHNFVYEPWHWKFNA